MCNTYATRLSVSALSDDYFTDTEIPDQIQRAQLELAIYLKNNVDGIGLSGLEDFQERQYRQP